jgi:xanthine dehydrogenase accessory factor
MRRANEMEIRPAAVVIGCGDVGSAIAHALHRAGCAVVLVDQADPPWTRRGMAYVDAWYVGAASLAGIDACFCASVRSIPFVLDRRDMIAATTWSWQGVASALQPIAVVDARVVKREPLTPIRQSGGPLTIGVGPGFVAEMHVDVAIETTSDETSGEVVHATRAGRFQTERGIGECVAPRDEVATLDGEPIAAPIGGALRGLAARGARIAVGQRIVEVDPHGDPSRCFGIDERPKRIATGVLEALARRRILVRSMRRDDQRELLQG